MKNFEITKIQLLSIIECINDYTDDPAIILPCKSLKEGLDKEKIDFELFSYFCNVIDIWYINNINKIISNDLVSNKGSHQQNLEILNLLMVEIYKNEDEYIKYLSSVPIIKISKVVNRTDVFIVHGRDDGVKNDVARFLEQIKLKPIILHEQSSDGDTIIEKIERYTNVGYGIVLYTPCDVGAISTDRENLNNRARQNVVFEHGYLIGKLSRENVCALVSGDIEKPNDLSGLVYVNYNIDGGWKLSLAKELRAAGYNIDLNIL